MADVQHNLDDPRWTAFVLGELDADEARQLMDCLAADPLLRRRIDELRETAELLRLAFDAEREDLPPTPNRKLHDATRRAALKMAIRPAVNASGGFPSAGPRATRTVVALASLAMVAVTLLVTTVTPSRLSISDLSIPVAPASVAWTEHFVWNTYNDADGVERINVAFRVTGDESIGDVQRDFVNGLNYFSVKLDDNVERMYVAENDVAPDDSGVATWASLAVSGESLSEEAAGVSGVAPEIEVLRQITLHESTVDLNGQGQVSGQGASAVEERITAADDWAREAPMSTAGLGGAPAADNFFYQEAARRRYSGQPTRFLLPTRTRLPILATETLVPRSNLNFDGYAIPAQDSPALVAGDADADGNGNVRTWSVPLPAVVNGAAATWSKFLSPLSAPVSEMPVTNDDRAYRIVAEYLGNGFLPPAESVYVDDLINLFAVPPPVADPTRPLSVTIEAAACPWQPEHRLARVTVSARPVAQNERPPVAMVAVVDTSESMQTNGRLETVEAALASLSDQLTEHDRFSVVTENGLESETVDGRPQDVVRNLRRLRPKPTFDEVRGLRLGFDVARKQYLDAGLNQILFCTDGAFGRDPMSQEELQRIVEQQSNSNRSVNLNGLGVQPHSANRPVLRELVRSGNGVYEEIDAKSPVPKVFFAKILGAAATVAEDVDIQVSFNPVAVAAYRRIGGRFDVPVVEPAEDDPTFGTMTAGTSLTSLYEIVPRSTQLEEDPNLLGRAVWQRLNQDSPTSTNVQVRRMNDRVTIDGIVSTEQHKQELERSVIALYRKPELVENRLQVLESELPDRGVPINDAFTVQVKYREPESGTEVRFDQVFVDDANDAPSPELKWAALVAEFGLMLENPSSLADATLEQVLEEVESSEVADDASRQRLAELVKQSQVTHGGAAVAGGLSDVRESASDARSSVGGKYANPVGQISAPDDARWYGHFYDFGRWDGGSYAGQSDLPPAYWVYVFPNWYIWSDTAPQPAGDANE